MAIIRIRNLGTQHTILQIAWLKPKSQDCNTRQYGKKTSQKTIGFYVFIVAWHFKAKHY